MTDWNRDRTWGGSYGDDDRYEHNDRWDRGRGTGYARQLSGGDDDYGGRSWDYGRDVRGGGYGTGTDRDEFAGSRGGGYLGGDYTTRGGGYGSSNYGSWDRTSGSSGNYFGGGGYGTTRDYDNYRDRELGVDRGGDTTERPSYRGRGPKNFQRSDERIREEVCERLADHDAIDASEIEVAVNNGEVTLTGHVDDRRSKRLAEDLAEIVRGVHDVHNNLKVDRSLFGRIADNLRGGHRSEGGQT